MHQATSHLPQPSDDALAIRDALRFRPDAVERALTSGCWTNDTLATYLRCWGRETPDAVAVAAPGYPSLTFGEALDRSERLAAALAAHGIGRGDVIAVQLPSGPDFILVYYAAALLGAVLSTLHTPYGPAEAEPLLRHARARAVVCGAATDKTDPPAMFGKLQSQLPNLKHVISVGPARPGVLSLAELIAAGDREALPPG
ncbi:MAG TPA: class I adenylate-forming enzyme family protein, partial [Xanthobacteraceae bacterium]|nr:class I adenylate-forming enzyme family protein [Xanthobacteraceae bacterium]